MSAERFDRLSDSVLLTEPEVSQVVGHPANTLKHWRLRGAAKGPSRCECRANSVRYRVGDVRAWLANLPEADDPQLDPTRAASDDDNVHCKRPMQRFPLASSRPRTQATCREYRTSKRMHQPM